jgi:transcriptional regulator with XRE-family HTH domain
MTKTLNQTEENRRERLLELKNRHGSIAKLAENVGVTPGYISQLLNKRRPITEKTARKIETTLMLEQGWLDRVSDEAQPQASLL